MRSAWLAGCWVQTMPPTCLTKTVFQTHNLTRYDSILSFSSVDIITARELLSSQLFFQTLRVCVAAVHLCWLWSKSH